MKYNKLVTAATLLTVLTGLTVAHGTSQSTSTSASSEAKIGGDIISHNFVITSTHAVKTGIEDKVKEKIDRAEQKAEKKIEKLDSSAETEIKKKRDENDSVTVDMEKAKEVARSELEDKWKLKESDLHEDDGYFKFEFSWAPEDAEGEAEVRVDASTAEIFRLEKKKEKNTEELERKAEKGLKKAEEKAEKAFENEDGSVDLSGFLKFRTGGFKVDTEAEKEENTIKFKVTVESPPEDSLTTQAINTQEVSESVEVKPGTYNAEVVVMMNGEKIHTKEKKVKVKAVGKSEKESEEDKEEKKEEGEKESELMEKSKEELVEMIKELRKEIESMQAKLEERQEHQGKEDSEEASKEKKKEKKEEKEQENKKNKQEEKEEETEKESSSSAEAKAEAKSNSEESRTEAKAEAKAEKEGKPAENSKRPGFVDNILSSIFG